MLVNINEIKVVDRIRKDFGNIQELADDIKENGLINPPVVTPDTYELIAGERRLRAMKLLGYNQIEVRPMAVKDAEHQLNLEISENETRKDFSKAERIDYARRLERVESLKARERMESGGTEIFPQGSKGEVRDIVAEKLNIGSGKQYEKEKFIIDNKSTLSTDDFAEWDEGKLSTNKTFLKIKEQLEEKENQIAGYILKLEKIKVLEKEINELNEELTNRPTNTIQVEVKPNDYDSNKSSLDGYKKDYKQLKTDYDNKVKEITTLKEQIESIQSVTEEEQYAKKLKDGAIFFCSRVNDFIEKTGGFVWLSDHITELPTYERKSYIKAIEMVENWATAMKMNMKQYLD